MRKELENFIDLYLSWSDSKVSGNAIMIDIVDYMKLTNRSDEYRFVRYYFNTVPYNENVFKLAVKDKKEFLQDFRTN